MELSARFLGFTTYGVQWVLWLLIGLSVISIGMMLERLWYFATYRPSPQGLAREMRLLLHSGGVRRAGSDGPVLAEALAEALDGAVEGAKARERLQLERNLAFLGTLGSNAPFIGLFGTVLGIIKAFHDLAGNQSGGPAVVMAGISEALVATAVGLMVAIPAVVAFNYFNRRVRTSMTQVDWMAHLALADVKASYADAANLPPPGPALVAGPAAAPLPWRGLIPIAAAAALVLIVGGVLIGRSSNPAPVRPAAVVTPTVAVPSIVEPSVKPPDAPPVAATPAAVATAAPMAAAPSAPPPIAPPPAPTPPAAAAPVAPPAVAAAPVATPPAAAAQVATPPVVAAPVAPPPAAPRSATAPKWTKWKKRRPAAAAPAPAASATSPAPAKPEEPPAKPAAPAKSEEPATPAAGGP